MILVSLSLSQREDCKSKGESKCYLPNLDVAAVSSKLVLEAQGNAASSKLKSRNSKGFIINKGCMPRPCGEDYETPVMTRSSLTPFSQTIYLGYAYFCCAIPSILVFGMPLTLLGLYISFPQEIFAILSLITSVAVFMNGSYMFVYAGFTLYNMKDVMRKAPQAQPEEEQGATGEPAEVTTPVKHRVSHWILMPQYLEDVEIVSIALRSIAQARQARASINIVLAMEAREPQSQEKANELKSRFAHCFNDIMVTFHPSGLPNDPPGKASNLQWAYQKLLAHLWAIGQDFSEVLLTVSDADSEFHEDYFPHLVKSYLDVAPDKRNLRIFQAPILHIKNYHRQPSPVIVGTMFTTMQELAATGDPNAVQFPYSTYSLSLELARRVDGWDPEWIAEDWHMGLKCWLCTLGNCRVEPILLPICNFTPEDETWWGTVNARWSQAKRHALGFSDLGYYFMMLPLVYAHASSRTSAADRIMYLRAFWGVVVHGTKLVVRIISVHVIIGVITLYGILQLSFKLVMEVFMTSERHVTVIFDRTGFWFKYILICSLVWMLLVTVLFNVAYHFSKSRIEKENVVSTVFKYNILHLLYTALCFIAFGPFYFALLAFAVWRAAYLLLTKPMSVFEYEVASKRTGCGSPRNEKKCSVPIKDAENDKQKA